MAGESCSKGLRNGLQKGSALPDAGAETLDSFLMNGHHFGFSSPQSWFQEERHGSVERQFYFKEITGKEKRS
jgi:hypothetical protein